MFNGIIFNTGKIYSIDKTKKSSFIGIQSNLNLVLKTLDHLFVAMVFVLH